MSGIDDGNDERTPNGSRDVEGRGRAVDWTRADFEAAIPLYVGGDLEPSDAERVERWIADHPEDALHVRAADEARSVLLSHARGFELRETPDLWPGIRAELARRAGERAGGMERAPGPEVEGAPRPLAAVGAASARRASWLQRPAFAAAAALLLVGTLGFGIAHPGGIAHPAGIAHSGGIAHPGGRDGSGALPAPGGTEVAPGATGSRFAAAARPAAIAGTSERPLDVTPTGAPAARRGMPLTPTNGDAEHLLPSAVPVHYLYPSLDPRLTPATESGVRLTGQR